MTAESAAGVPQVMKRLGQRYVQHINRIYQRTGGLIEADAYLLACQRYIELNPVRAGMVEAPADYRWSSYRANAPLGMLTPSSGRTLSTTPWPRRMMPCAQPIGACSRPNWMRTCYNACASANGGFAQQQ